MQRPFRPLCCRSVCLAPPLVASLTPSFALLQDEDADEKAKARRASKPAEWRALFSGNVDDHFRLGIKLTRGAIKYGHALCT